MPTPVRPANPPDTWAALRRLGVAATLILLACGVWKAMKTQPIHPAPAAPVIAYRLPINHADPEELSALPGVGPIVARTIAQHRDEHGPFRVTQDLTNVRGIGELTAQRISQWVRFD